MKLRARGGWGGWGGRVNNRRLAYRRIVKYEFETLYTSAGTL